VFDSWWSLRFLLLSWPFLVIGIVAVLRRIAALNGSIGRPLAWLVVVLIANHGLTFAREHSTFERPPGDWRFAAMAEAVTTRTDEQSVIYSMMHSGSLTYYAGRDIINYSTLDPSWLDRSVDWVSCAGRHAYAVLEDWEVDDFRRRFAGQATAELRQPILTYRGSRTVFLFDLSRSAPPEPEIIVERSDRVRTLEPRLRALSGR